MGCSSMKDDLESKIMFLKLDRIGVIQERHQKLKELEKITGHKVKWRKVPDYVVHDNNNEIQHIKHEDNNNAHNKKKTKEVSS